MVRGGITVGLYGGMWVWLLFPGGWALIPRGRDVGLAPYPWWEGHHWKIFCGGDMGLAPSSAWGAIGWDVGFIPGKRGKIGGLMGRDLGQDPQPHG